MTLKKVKQVLMSYDSILEKEGYEIDDNKMQMESHIRWMCKEVNTWNYKRKEKAMRWLGFIQGWFCANGKYDIEDLKFHNRIN
jgi:hypothetical protein